MATTERSDGGAPSGPAKQGRASRSPRKQAPGQREAPVAFRPRLGDTARLQQRAAGRPLSAVLQQAVASYLDRRVVEPPRGLREALVAELGPIYDTLQKLTLQQVGIGRNINQLARFVNTYGETPVSLSESLVSADASNREVLDRLEEVQAALDRVAQWPRQGATT